MKRAFWRGLRLSSHSLWRAQIAAAAAAVPALCVCCGLAASDDRDPSRPPFSFSFSFGQWSLHPLSFIVGSRPVFAQGSRTKSVRETELRELLSRAETGEWRLGGTEEALLRERMARFACEEARVSHISLSQLQKETVELRKSLEDKSKGKGKTGGVDEETLARFVALLCRASEVLLGKRPRTAQIAALLLLCNHNGERDGSVSRSRSRGWLLQFLTGEGKTLVIAFLALKLSFLEGRKVDVATASPLLASRDAEEMRPLFGAFGISVGHTCDDSTSEPDEVFDRVYSKDVVYMDCNQGQADLILHEFYGDGRRGERKTDVLIADEVDNLFVDRLRFGTKFAEHLGGAEVLTPLLLDVYARVRMSPGRALQELSAETLAEVERGSLLCPHILKRFVTQQMDDWVGSAAAAASMEEGRQFLVLPSQTTAKGPNTPSVATSSVNVPSRVVPVDAESTGVVLHGVQWQGGLTQMVEAAEGLPLSPPSLPAAFISNLSFFKRYSRLYGLSGTLGSADERTAMEALYDVDCRGVPPHRPSRLSFKGTSVAPLPAGGAFVEAEEREKGRKLWGEAVALRAREESVRLGRAVLVVCEHVVDAEMIKELLESPKDSPKNVFLYTRDDIEEQRRVPERELQGGDVVVATNLGGRGTDFRVSREVAGRGGLHVLLTFMPSSERVERQAFGRAARGGDAGSCELVVPGERGEGGRILDARGLRARRDRAFVERAGALVGDAAVEAQRDTLFRRMAELQSRMLRSSRRDVRGWNDDDSTPFQRYRTLNAARDARLEGMLLLEERDSKKQAEGLERLERKWMNWMEPRPSKRHPLPPYFAPASATRQGNEYADVGAFHEAFKCYSRAAALDAPPVSKEGKRKFFWINQSHAAKPIEASLSVPPLLMLVRSAVSEKRANPKREGGMLQSAQRQAERQAAAFVRAHAQAAVVSLLDAQARRAKGQPVTRKDRKEGEEGVMKLSDLIGRTEIEGGLSQDLSDRAAASVGLAEVAADAREQLIEALEDKRELWNSNKQRAGVTARLDPLEAAAVVPERMRASYREQGLTGICVVGPTDRFFAPTLAPCARVACAFLFFSGARLLGSPELVRGLSAPASGGSSHWWPSLSRASQDRKKKKKKDEGDPEVSVDTTAATREGPESHPVLDAYLEGVMEALAPLVDPPELLEGGEKVKGSHSAEHIFLESLIRTAVVRQARTLAALVPESTAATTPEEARRDGLTCGTALSSAVEETGAVGFLRSALHSTTNAVKFAAEVVGGIGPESEYTVPIRNRLLREFEASEPLQKRVDVSLFQAPDNRDVVANSIRSAIGDGSSAGRAEDAAESSRVRRSLEVLLEEGGGVLPEVRMSVPEEEHEEYTGKRTMEEERRPSIQNFRRVVAEQVNRAVSDSVEAAKRGLCPDTEQWEEGWEDFFFTSKHRLMVWDDDFGTSVEASVEELWKMAQALAGTDGLSNPQQQAEGGGVEGGPGEERAKGMLRDLVVRSQGGRPVPAEQGGLDGVVERLWLDGKYRLRTAVERAETERGRLLDIWTSQLWQQESARVLATLTGVLHSLLRDRLLGAVERSAGLLPSPEASEWAIRAREKRAAELRDLYRRSQTLEEPASTSDRLQKETSEAVKDANQDLGLNSKN